VFHFRRIVELTAVPSRLVVHVSADNRYILHVNGRRVGAGPARGDVWHWPFESYDLAPFLHTGRNIVAANVWNFGTLSPMAQMSRRTGFLLQEDDGSGVLNTNKSGQAQIERAHAPNGESLLPLRSRRFYYAAGPGERRDGRAYDWQWDTLDSPADRWVAATEVIRAHPRSIREGPGWMMTPEGWLLVPSQLPPMEHRPDRAGAIVRATDAEGARDRAAVPFTAAPHTHTRLLFDRGEIINAYPALVISGAGTRRFASRTPRRCTTPKARKAIATRSRGRTSRACTTSSSPTAARGASSSRSGSARGASSRSSSGRPTNQ
jgi:hypothetical protein